MSWDIFDEMKKMQEEMDSMFEKLFSRPYYPRLGQGSSLREADTEQRKPYMRKAFVDMQETEKDIVVTAELPGMDRQDIELNVTSDRIEIKAEKVRESTEEKEGERAYGRRYAGFYRNVPLPVAVNSEDAKATYKNGVLEVTLPKKEVIKSRSIKIE